MKLLKAVWRVSVYTAAIFGMCLCVAAIFLDKDTKIKLIDVIKGPHSDGYDGRWRSVEGEELIKANSQHWNMAYYISKCFPGIDISGGANGLSGMVANQFLIGTQPGGELRWGDAPAGDVDVKLTTYQRNLLVLSQSLSVIRSQANAATIHHQDMMYLLQGLIVLSGAITTIFVSIKSMSGDGSKDYRWIGVLAIVFSAASTAFSSINSFAGPVDSYIRAARTLHQARAAHLDLSFTVAQDNKICDEANYGAKDDERLKKISDLSAKIKEISASNSSFSTISNSSGGGGLPSSSSTNSIK